MISNSAYAMKTTNGNVKVVFEGEHYLKSENTEEIFNAVQEYRQESTEENADVLRRLLNPHLREELDGPLERDGLGNLYLEGFSQPLSQEMGTLLQSHLDQGLGVDPFVNFWQRLQLNPSRKARTDFLEYIQDFGITITDEGYAVLYKAVNENPHADIDPDLVQFVGQEYLQHQMFSNKPAPREVYVAETATGYEVVEGDSTAPDLSSFDLAFDELTEVLEKEGIIHQNHPENSRPVRFEYPVGSTDNYTASRISDIPYPEVERIAEELAEVRPDLVDTTDSLGRLDDLYSDIVEATDATFIPSHTSGDYGQAIELGDPETMPRHECDPDSSRACSYGLHVGSHKYVQSFGMRMDTILAVVVNPRDIVALPDYDHSKIRTCRYLPYAVMEREEDGTWTEIESVQVQVDQLNEDFDYEGELETLEEQDGLTDLEEDRRDVLANRVQTIS